MTILQLDSDEVKVNETVDITDCVKQMIQQNEIAVKQASLKIMFQFICDGEDLSRLKDAHVRMLNDTHQCIGAPEVALLNNVEVTVSADINSSLAKGTYSIKSFTGTMAPDGSACYIKADGDKWVYDPCLELQKSTDSINISGLQSTKQTVNNFRLLTSEKLVGKKGSLLKFFESGSKKLQLNQWSGSVNYSNSTTPPHWSLSKDSEKAEGEYQP